MQNSVSPPAPPLAAAVAELVTTTSYGSEKSPVDTLCVGWPTLVFALITWCNECDARLLAVYQELLVVGGELTWLLCKGFVDIAVL